MVTQIMHLAFELAQRQGVESVVGSTVSPPLGSRDNTVATAATRKDDIVVVGFGLCVLSQRAIRRFFISLSVGK